MSESAEMHAPILSPTEAQAWHLHGWTAAGCLHYSDDNLYCFPGPEQVLLTVRIVVTGMKVTD